MLRLCKSFGKLVFFKSKNSVLDVEPYLKIKIIKSQAAKIICFFSRTCNSIFLISECYFLKLKKPKHIWKPLPTLLKTAVRKGFEIFEKSGVQIFPEKMEQLVKQVRLFFLKKRKRVSHIPFKCYLSESVWCVYVCFVYVNHFYQFYSCFTGRAQSHSI